MTNARFGQREKGLCATGDAGERQLSFFNDASVGLPAPVAAPSAPKLHGVVEGRAPLPVPSRQSPAKGRRGLARGERIALTERSSGSSLGASSVGADYFRWWYVDDRTGKQRRSSHHMTAHEALLRWKGATADPLIWLHRAAGLNTTASGSSGSGFADETRLPERAHEWRPQKYLTRQESAAWCTGPDER